jgi:hypothetical protein
VLEFRRDVIRATAVASTLGGPREVLSAGAAPWLIGVAIMMTTVALG